MKNKNLSTIEEIIEDAKEGKMFIIVDDENRENEGDLVITAAFADKDAINFMAKYGRGLICLAMPEDRVRQLNLPLMSPLNNSRHGTAFTISIEAKEGVSTGISAADRAHTIATAIDINNNASDIVTPGHVFPLISRKGGVLTRAGHTEAAVDIAKLASLDSSRSVSLGLAPSGVVTAGVICEIMNDDGTMARLPDLIKFAKEHDLKIASIADLISYRRNSENLVTKKSSAKVTTKYGVFNLSAYVSNIEYAEHLVFTHGDLDYNKIVNVRMHSQDILSDIFGVEELASQNKLSKSFNYIAKNNGIVVILRSPQKNTVSEALDNLNKSNNHKKSNIIRDYGIGAQILKDMGVTNMNLLTSEQKSIIGLESYGLNIVNYVSF
jgi:3,4-dihydroxy 2-butanone 4-phosphate synthase/GTP cyclohydrolase II